MATKKSTSSKKKSSSKSTTISTKKVIKSAQKMAKKNPKGFLIAVLVVAVVAGACVGGYFIWKSMQKPVNSETMDINFLASKSLSVIPSSDK